LKLVKDDIKRNTVTLEVMFKLLAWLFAQENCQKCDGEGGTEMKSKKKIISIEGNIASGKSTCVDSLRVKFADNQHVKVLLEPLHIWQEIKDKNGVDMISKFYADIPKYSFAFQMMAYISRLTILREALNDPEVEVIITERSLLTDKHVFAKMLHDNGDMEDVEHQIYMRWFDDFFNELPKHDLFYIRTDPEVAHLRLQTRAREGENVPLDYLKHVHRYHESWLGASEQVVVIDGNVDKNSDESPAAVMIKHVTDYLAN
jgi:deoxyadenosine/deoxycytidine kinase